MNIKLLESEAQILRGGELLFFLILFFLIFLFFSIVYF